MNNQQRLQAAPELHDKDESIFQALMTAIVEHQLPPGSKLPEEALAGAVPGSEKCCSDSQPCKWPS